MWLSRVLYGALTFAALAYLAIANARGILPFAPSVVADSIDRAASHRERDRATNRFHK